MKILAISDIHGRTNFDKKIIDLRGDVDLVVISGDITNFGGKREALNVLNKIKEINQQILAVFGNCDQPEVYELLKSENINLHNVIKELGDITFFGIGGSGYTPFNTPQEFSNTEIKEFLSTYKKRGGFQIFVSHSPPINTKVDKTLMGGHGGNKIIRDFIEQNQPDLCICGHIHEARNIDKIGRTMLVNPGPFPPNYALIKITDTIDVNLSD